MTQIEKDVFQANNIQKILREDIDTLTIKIKLGLQQREDIHNKVEETEEHVKALGLDKGSLLHVFDTLTERLQALESENITLEKTLHMQTKRLDKRIHSLQKIIVEKNQELNDLEGANQELKGNFHKMDRYESERELSYLNHIAKVEQRKIERITRGQHHKGLSEDFGSEQEVHRFTSADFTPYKRVNSAAYISPVKLYAKSMKKPPPYLYPRGFGRAVDPF